ncbi:MAG: hypothetical protein J6L05_01400 [Ruminococcus sp.]|nr:hypothetical protein [Ruminococcus sp.]
MKLFKNIIAILAALTLTAGAAPASVYAAPSMDISITEYAHLSSRNYFSTTDEAAAYVKQQIKNRVSDVTFSIPATSEPITDVFDEIMTKILAETRIGDDGDYIRLGIYGCGYGYSSGGRSITLKYTFTYFTNAEQEAALNEKLEEVMDSLNLDGKSDYEKICAIHRYITNNVSYADNMDDMTIFSAYGALVKGKAVCQGYAQLLYRMLTEAGIYSRVIEGTSNNVNHAWNIAEIDGLYYLIDATYDSAYSSLSMTPYLLKGTSDFDDADSTHTHITGTGNPQSYALYPDYTSDEFNKQYKINETAYNPANPAKGYTLGDVNSDGFINAIDASRTLYSYAETSATGTSSFTAAELRAANVNGDKYVNAVDASYLLKYYAEISSGSPFTLTEFLDSLK